MTKFRCYFTKNFLRFFSVRLEFHYFIYKVVICSPSWDWLILISDKSNLVEILISLVSLCLRSIMLLHPGHFNELRRHKLSSLCLVLLFLLYDEDLSTRLIKHSKVLSLLELTIRGNFIFIEFVRYLILTCAFSELFNHARFDVVHRNLIKLLDTWD